MSSTSDWLTANTQHGMLVAFGEFLKQHGVIDRLMTAALVQDTHFGMALQFAPESPFPSVTLFMKSVPAFQPALGFNQPCRIESG